MTCDEAADHYTHLAQQPGWKQYVRERIKEMDSDESGVYRGLYEAVNQRLKALAPREHTHANHEPAGAPSTGARSEGQAVQAPRAQP